MLNQATGYATCPTNSQSHRTQVLGLDLSRSWAQCLVDLDFDSVVKDSDLEAEDLDLDLNMNNNKNMKTDVDMQQATPMSAAVQMINYLNLYA